MENLRDFEMDSQGKRWEPQAVGERFVFYRSVHYGHVRNLVVPLENGQPNFDKGMRFSEKTDALSYIFKQEGKLPQQFVCSRAREILARYQR